MTTVTIDNPIINSPFDEPRRHFLFSANGITDTLGRGRRKSVYFVPVPRPRLKGKTPARLTVSKTLNPRPQPNGKTLELDLEITSTAQENHLINAIRESVGLWRATGYPGVTTVTRRLLEHWQHPDRERKLFFCQIEALETIIYLTEIAPDKGGTKARKLLKRLKDANAQATPAGHSILQRYAAKMATGSGKTVVMAMLIAWQTLNKQAEDAKPKDKDKKKKEPPFTDRFLIVAPGITIKDRLRTLLPSDPDNYYRALDLVPAAFQDGLGQAKIVITNYHAFMLREGGEAAGLTKRILTGKRDVSPFRETPGQMIARLCGSFGTQKDQVIVLNDEAHHCYHRKPVAALEEKLTGAAKREAERREADARVWISGLEALKKQRGIKAVYDLSATPFFLAGSGYHEGELFPWVVSDFALIDAIESGIVKVPRVPVADNTDQQESPVYRRLWDAIGKQLPSGTRAKKAEAQTPQLPKELEGALHHLYSDYAKSYAGYQVKTAAGWDLMPPVYIVVCSNTQVSKLVFDWIAGYEKALNGGETVIVPGQLPIFSNVERHGEASRWSHRPNTLLIDSQALESGEALTDDFKQAAAREIDEFKAEIRERFPGRAVEALTHEDILREVMNTVGKKGKLGEHIKCVVSVSMLTEGWDANTVTHILGVRAFGTQLICEQVIGRGLRRMSYEPEPQTVLVDGESVTFDAFPVEYAEVYGVPFEFLPTGGGSKRQRPKDSTHISSVENHSKARIVFPRLTGYRHEIAAQQFSARFTESSRLILNSKQLPTIVENAPIIGASSIQRLDDLKARRINEVVFLLAKLVLERYFREESATEYAIGGRPETEVKGWLFPQLLNIARRWLHECVIPHCQDDAFPQLLLLVELAHTAADRIYQAIVSGDTSGDAPRLKPILQPYNTQGDTGGIGYLSTKATWRTNHKSHISHVVLDSGWEGTVAKSLEDMDEVHAYVKNIPRLDFLIPYTVGGQTRTYLVDFIARIDDGHGAADLLNLLIEVSGEKRDDKDAKVATVQTLWVPAVNNDGRFGRWGFVQVKDPHDAKNNIRDFFRSP
ncbi:BPTD_3080 family restriction endonuclease [uncultured Thiodictyon sp.]|jgi:type III restriction enzyme|uniref:BPTD_3080 family restriction endonuclease n=1 Tax=uncultured Thiodictyon sp. TaxID=1846217 RepID=UPI0025D2D5C4|nr:DEAD/DEAH box helicase family protein [uncultured Thiodictyon sp.]